MIYKAPTSCCFLVLVLGLVVDLGPGPCPGPGLVLCLSPSPRTSPRLGPSRLSPRPFGPRYAALPASP